MFRFVFLFRYGFLGGTSSSSSQSVSMYVRRGSLTAAKKCGLCTEFGSLPSRFVSILLFFNSAWHESNYLLVETRTLVDTSTKGGLKGIVGRVCVGTVAGLAFLDMNLMSCILLRN